MNWSFRACVYLILFFLFCLVWQYQIMLQGCSEVFIGALKWRKYYSVTNCTRNDDILNTCIRTALIIILMNTLLYQVSVLALDSIFFHGHSHANENESQRMLLLICLFSYQNCSCHCFRVMLRAVEKGDAVWWIWEVLCGRLWGPA